MAKTFCPIFVLLLSLFCPKAKISQIGQKLCPIFVLLLSNFVLIMMLGQK
jgi:hypothetical protein